MSEHTPGPWMIEPREVTALLLGKDGTHLANIFANDSSIFQPESKWANARLIATAPEMADTIAQLTARVKELEEAISNGAEVLDDLSQSLVEDDVLLSLIEEFRAALTTNTKREA